MRKLAWNGVTWLLLAGAVALAAVSWTNAQQKQYGVACWEIGVACFVLIAWQGTRRERATG